MTSSEKLYRSEHERLHEVEQALRTRYWSWTMHSLQEGPPTLLQLLCERLPHIAQHSWPSRFAFGGIYINGIEALQDQPLPIPCRVEYYEPKFDINSASAVFPPFMREYVIYRDEHILVAYKPAGLSSMPAKEQRLYSLKASIEQLVGAPIHMPSRLDVSAQGLVVVSISPKAHAVLQQAFESRTVLKTYLCASGQAPEWESHHSTEHIGRDPLHPVLRTTTSREGQPAETFFRYLGTQTSEGRTVHVLSAQPITGRTHQIRVHAAHAHVALVGDRFYGGAQSSYLHLISYGLSLKHPITRTHFECTLPQALQPEWVQKISQHSA